jgi:cell division protein ZapB
MPDSQFNALEQKIDDLINLCAELNQENVGLKADATTLQTEKQDLASRNLSARSKLEAILNRLKAMEQDS